MDTYETSNQNGDIHDAAHAPGKGRYRKTSFAAWSVKPFALFATVP